MDFLLDTNICVFHLRGLFDLFEFVKGKNYKLAVSEITVLELYIGAERNPQKKKAYETVDQLLSDFEIVTIQNVRKLYAEEKAGLFKKGTPLHNDFDLLIGVTAVHYNKILVTDNLKDFKNIRNLQLENWIKR